MSGLAISASPIIHFTGLSHGSDVGESGIRVQKMTRVQLTIAVCLRRDASRKRCL